MTYSSSDFSPSGVTAPGVGTGAGTLAGKPSSSQISADQLRAVVEKIERLEQEKAQIAEFIRDVMSEAKSFGFDTKILRQVLKLRKMDKQDVEEQEELLTLYCHALGM